jgi:hypothetical protein
MEVLDRAVVPVGTGRQRLPVLFVGGLGRSGSTVLDMLLAQEPGMVPIGEVRHLWERGLRDNDLCACGTPFHDCLFWQAVGDHAFGGWHRLDPAYAVAAARAVDRHRRLPVTASALGRRSVPLVRYAGMLQRLYAGVLAVSGGQVVVDSSKDPPHGFVLRHVPGIDLRAVHLVRDSRGVAYSWAKSVVRPDAGSMQLMTRMAPWRTALMWMDTNMLMGSLGHAGVPSMRIRYEDMVADPAAAIRAIRDLAGVSPAAGVAQHAIGGNPVRFREGPLRLRVDQDWLSGMTRGEERLVTGITAPLLRRYGYQLRSNRE